MKRTLNIAIIGISLSLATPVAVSQTSGDREIRPYLGGGIGYYRLDDEDFLNENDRLKDDHSAWRAFGGVEFGRIFSLQAGHIDFGETSDGNADMEADGQTISGMVALPLSDTFAPYAKVGNLSWDRERSLGPITSSDSGDDPFYGAGVRLTLTEHTDLRLQYERFTLEDTDLDMASAAVQYNF